MLLLPVLVLSALDVRAGTAVPGSCKDGVVAVAVLEEPLSAELPAVRNADVPALGRGGALAFALCWALLHVDGIGAVRERAMLLPSAAKLLLLRLRVEDEPSTGDLGAPNRPLLGGGDVRKVASFVGTGGGRPSINLRNSYFLRIYFSSSLSLSLSSMLVGGRLRISSGLKNLLLLMLPTSFILSTCSRVHVSSVSDLTLEI